MAKIYLEQVEVVSRDGRFSPREKESLMMIARRYNPFLISYNDLRDRNPNEQKGYLFGVATPGFKILCIEELDRESIYFLLDKKGLAEKFKDELIDEDVATGIWIRPLFEFPIVKRYTGVGKSKS